MQVQQSVHDAGVSGDLLPGPTEAAAEGDGLHPARRHAHWRAGCATVPHTGV